MGTQRAIISTPIPTLDEVAKNLGMSKQRQNQLLTIVRKHTQEQDSRPSNASSGDPEKAKAHRTRK